MVWHVKPGWKLHQTWHTQSVLNTRTPLRRSNQIFFFNILLVKIMWFVKNKNLRWGFWPWLLQLAEYSTFGLYFRLQEEFLFSLETLRFLCLNERNISLVAICAVILSCKDFATKRHLAPALMHFGTRSWSKMVVSWRMPIYLRSCRKNFV